MNWKVQLVIRRSLAISLLALVASGLVFVACGIDTPGSAARPRATVNSILTPTVFEVIDVTPVPAELVAEFDGTGSAKPVPPALDTRFTILEPRIEVVLTSWHQYLSGTRIQSDDGVVDWSFCADNTGKFNDSERTQLDGRWRIHNPPRSLDWHEVVVGTYGEGDNDRIVVMSMFEGLPHMTFTNWDDAPSRGGRPSDVAPLRVGVTALDDADCPAS